MSGYSQARQDEFVLSATNHKQNGWFVEIGSNDPIVTNNTYLLENKYNWSGLMVEYDGLFLERYKQVRPRSTYQISDARKVDYTTLLKSFPRDIDYLQVDLDVNNRSTLDVIEFLDRTVLNDHRFTCMTIEHDIYSGDYFQTREKSRAIFTARGYTLLFPDVCVWWQNGFKPFEDWYVHPELAPHMLFFKTDQSLSADEIMHIIAG